jgi:hypothetical protein
MRGAGATVTSEAQRLGRIRHVAAALLLVAAACSSGTSRSASSTSTSTSAPTANAASPTANGLSAESESPGTITFDYAGQWSINQTRPQLYTASRRQRYRWDERITLRIPACATSPNGDKGCSSTPADDSSFSFSVVGAPKLTITGTASARAIATAPADIAAELNCTVTASAAPVTSPTRFPILVHFALHQIVVSAIVPGAWTHWTVNQGAPACANTFVAGGGGFAPVNWQYEPIATIDQVLPYTKTYSTPNGSATFHVTGEETGKYAALGDSFSTGSIAPFTDPGDSCLRSEIAYPWIYDQASIAFLACSGASSATVLSEQVPLIPSNAQVVSVTAGGDDIPVYGVLIDCLQYRILDHLTNLGLGEPCFAHARIDLAQAMPQVQTSLVRLYHAIYLQAPQARIYALGYPNPLPASFRPGSCPRLETAVIKGVTVPAIDSRDVGFLHNVVEALNSRVRAAANAAGHVQYVEPFVGHDLCSANPWFFPLSVGFPIALHPTVAGHQRMAADLRPAAGPPP